MSEKTSKPFSEFIIERITPDTFLKFMLCFVGMMIPTVWSLSLAAINIEKATLTDIKQNTAHASYEITLNTLMINQQFTREELKEIKQLIREL